MTHVSVTAPDGLRVAMTLFRPAGASAGDPVPILLHAHGAGGSRWKNLDAFDTCSLDGDRPCMLTVRALLDAGFGVASFDQRGHGESEGLRTVMAPAERLAGLALIDYLATLPWVMLDGPGDPRMGTFGISLGGGFQTLVALEETARTGRTRIDALVPTLSPYDSVQGFAPDDAPRSAHWMNGLSLGALSNRTDPEFQEILAHGIATGRLPRGEDGAPDGGAYFAARSPRTYVEAGVRIDKPMMVMGATIDTLFPLDHQFDLYEQALTDDARARSRLWGWHVGHNLPSVGTTLLPFRESCVDGANPPWIPWFRHTLLGEEDSLGAKVRLASGDDHCLEFDEVPHRIRRVEADTGPAGVPVGVGAGAPVLIPLGQGPLQLAGAPKLSATITSTSSDGVLFVGLAKALEYTGDPKGPVIFHLDEQWTPIRFSAPATTLRDVLLAPVVEKVGEGETLFLIVTPVNDYFLTSASREPGVAVLTDVTVGVPKLNKVPSAAGEHDGAAADRLNPVVFTDRSTDEDGNIVAWQWDFGDGTASTQQHPEHLYAQLGTFPVTLTVTDDDGASASAPLGPVGVRNLPPLAAFAPVLPEANRIEAVPFGDASVDPDGRVVAWSWDFGDGSTSEETSPSHTYTRLGMYTARLTVTDNDGAVATSRAATITVVNLLPTGGMEGNGGAGAQSAEIEANRVDPVEFTDRSTDRDGHVALWAWTFGDGETSAGQDPSHQYMELGLYDAHLVPTDNDGDAGSTAELRVRVVNLLPQVGWSQDEEYPMVLVPVEFTDASTDRDGEIVEWTWDFGDGSSSKEQSPSHVFLEGGWHTVALTVTDSDGGVASLVKDLYVCAPGAETDSLFSLEHFRLEFEACLRVNGVDWPL